MWTAFRLTAALALLAGVAAVAAAQESRGTAEIAAQGFYAPGGVEPVRATTGMAASFRFILPTGALLEGRAEDYASSGLRLTENYLTVRGLAAGAWRMEFSGGDLQTPGRPMDVFMPQVFTPLIRMRGARVAGIRGRLSWTGYAGVVTFLEGPRLPFSVRGPQTLTGGGLRWKAGETLEFAGQVDTLRTDPERAAARPYLSQSGRQYGRSTQATVAGQWKPAEGVRVVGEAALTTGRPADELTVAPARGNALVSGEYERGRVMARASWLRQTAGYLPVAGYFAGDRGGAFVEGRLRVRKGLEVSGSTGSLRNNFENNPAAWGFRSKSATAGVSAEMPGRVVLSGHYSQMRLESAAPGEEVSRRNVNRQVLLAAARSYGRQTTRVNWRSFDLDTGTMKSKQGAVEAEHSVRLGRWSASGAFRLNNMQGAQRRDAVFVRGMMQGRAGRMTMHAYSEVGRDLANDTLFALNQVQTTVAGFQLPVGKDWSVQADVLRNHLAMALNPQSAFVLALQGAPPQLALGGMERWNVFVRVTRQVRWGGAAPAGSAVRTLQAMAPVMGSVEGFVKEADGTPGVGIPVLLDGRRIEYTDEVGRYRFPDVMQGEHRVELSPRELPAEFDPAGTPPGQFHVQSAKVARVDLTLERLTALRGQVLGVTGMEVESVVIRLEGTDRATTPRDDGHFGFYNLRAGRYRVVVDEGTAPEGWRLATPAAVEVEISGQVEGPEVFFVLERAKAEKRVRTITLD
ncbi:MAG TPA: hypothetical protein PLF84_05575 [Bryobacteraceae bacterium]|nr:hypothetical protein [Bryobacteraceae bacterium]